MPHQSVSDLLLQLLQTDHLLTAPQLVEKIHAQGKRVNKTSVYRALDKLMEQNQICQHNLSRNAIVYELRDHHHDHLVCENCGKVKVIDCQLDVPPMIDGYKLSHHHATFYGICSDCQT